MKVLRNLAEFPPEARGGAVSIGNFDGVHLGHREILGELKKLAAKIEGPSILFTFDPPPAQLLRPDLSPTLLTWPAFKEELLESLGIDCLIFFPTTHELLSLSAKEFFQHILLDSLHARGIVEGPNFYFGKDREGDVTTLTNLAQNQGIAIQIVPPCTKHSDIVSSSRIRSLIQQGDISLANELLSRPYRLRGVVATGAGRGKELGFPTANLEAIETLVPGQGVYAGRSNVEGNWIPSAIHIGPNPTFDDAQSKVEVHLIGLEKNLYGESLEVEFLQKLRNVEQFSSLELLLEQIHRDIADVVRLCSP